MIDYDCHRCKASARGTVLDRYIVLVWLSRPVICLPCRALYGLVRRIHEQLSDIPISASILPFTGERDPADNLTISLLISNGRALSLLSTTAYPEICSFLAMLQHI